MPTSTHPNHWADSQIPARQGQLALTSRRADSQTPARQSPQWNEMSERMNEWMNEGAKWNVTDERINVWMKERMNEWMKRMNQWMSEWNEWNNEWINQWMNALKWNEMNEWINEWTQFHGLKRAADWARILRRRGRHLRCLKSYPHLLKRLLNQNEPWLFVIPAEALLVFYFRWSWNSAKMVSSLSHLLKHTQK